MLLATSAGVLAVAVAGIVILSQIGADRRADGSALLVLDAERPVATVGLLPADGIASPDRAAAAPPLPASAGPSAALPSLGTMLQSIPIEPGRPYQPLEQRDRRLTAVPAVKRPAPAAAPAREVPSALSEPAEVRGADPPTAIPLPILTPAPKPVLFAALAPAPPGPEPARPVVAPPDVTPQAEAAAASDTTFEAEMDTAADAPKVDPALLIARGNEFLGQSDVTSARLFYGLAASHGSAAGALAMASTYDPVVLRQRAVKGVQPDPVTAVEWYRKAASLGAAEGNARAAALLDQVRRQAADGNARAKALLETSQR
jgi:hypothetical protein